MHYYTYHLINNGCNWDSQTYSPAVMHLDTWLAYRVKEDYISVFIHFERGDALHMHNVLCLVN